MIVVLGVVSFFAVMLLPIGWISRRFYEKVHAIEADQDTGKLRVILSGEFIFFKRTREMAFREIDGIHLELTGGAPEGAHVHLKVEPEFVRSSVSNRIIERTFTLADYTEPEGAVKPFFALARIVGLLRYTRHSRDAHSIGVHFFRGEGEGDSRKGDHVPRPELPA